MSTKHYIYIWSIDEYGIIYVGQGKKTTTNPYRRAFSNHTKQKFLQSGLAKYPGAVDVKILSDNLTKEQADEKEKYIINLLGRVIKNDGKLYNISIGGAVDGRKNKKPIYVNNMWFESVQDCAEYYGVSHGKICHCIRDGREIVPENRTTKLHTYNGKEYTTKELAELLNITSTCLLQRLKNGSIIENPQKTPQIVNYNGKEYTIMELAKYFSVTRACIRDRLENNIPLDSKIIRKIKIIINGVEYNSMCEASRKTGLTEKHIRYWYNKGKYCENSSNT